MIGGHMLSRTLPVVLFGTSGGVALVLEVVWLRRLHLVFGGTALATAAVTAAFMAGLALGNLLAARRGDTTARPLRWYGFLEAGIAAYAIAVPWLLEAVVPLYQAGASVAAGSPLALNAWRFLLSLLVLAPPTTAMGATLPLLTRHLAAHGAVPPALGLLYAVNTTGALLGTLFAGFVALPRLGERQTTLVAAGVDLAVALIALGWDRRARPAVPAAPSGLSAAVADAIRPVERLAMGIVAISGAVALACQVAWTRWLAMLLGSSVYAFTAILACVLAGIAVGSAAVAHLPAGLATRPRACLAVALAVAAWSVLAGAALGNHWPWVAACSYGAVQPGTAWLAQIAVAALLVGLPSAALGTLPPLAVRVAAPEPWRASRVVGRIFAANTAGAIVGAAGAGLALIPLIGMRGTLLGAGVALALAGAALTLASGARLRLLTGAAILGPALALAAVAPRWLPGLLVSQPYTRTGLGPGAPDETVFRRGYGPGIFLDRAHVEGATSTVTILETPTHVILYVDGKPDASSVGDMPTQVLLGHLPLLLHPGPRDVLVIGFGSGVSVGAAAHHPGAQVTCVEIEPAVVAVQGWFAPVNGRPLERQNVRIVTEDARTYLLARGDGFDAIVSEPSNPWLSGPAKLFTQEFFALVKRRLRPGGVFGQWIHTYGLQPDHLRALVRTFLDAFPDGRCFVTIEGADLLLVGGSGTGPVDWPALDARAQAGEVGADLARVLSASAAGLCARYVGGPADLRRFASGGSASTEEPPVLPPDDAPPATDPASGPLPGPRNTDDNGLIEYGAPWSILSDTAGQDTWKSVNGLDPDPAALLGDPPGGRAAALVAMARAALDRREGAMAERWARRSLSLELTAAAREVLGRALLLTGADLPGANALEDALVLDPGRVEARWRLAEALLGSRDAQAAVDLLLAAPERTPPLQALLAIALADAGRLPEAAEAFASVTDALLDAELPRGRAWRARARAAMGDSAGALADLLVHYGRNPDDVGHLPLLRDLHRHAGHAAEADAVMRRAQDEARFEEVFGERLTKPFHPRPEAVVTLREAVALRPYDASLRQKLVETLRQVAGDPRDPDAAAQWVSALAAGTEGLVEQPGAKELAVDTAFTAECLAEATADPARRRAHLQVALDALLGLRRAGWAALAPTERDEFGGRIARLEKRLAAGG